MAYGIVLEFDGVTQQQYDAVNEKLGIDMAAGTGDWPAGLTSHAGGTTAGGGFCVFEVWESKAQQQAWIGGRLGAALGAVGVPEPVRVTEIDIVGYATPG
jgi:hypothetical protein